MDAPDIYHILAEKFNESMGGQDDSEVSVLRQLAVAVEEQGELAEALVTQDEDLIREEIADNLVTTFLLADQLDINAREAYMEKMEYNLGKSGEREGGKIVDDADENDGEDNKRYQEEKPEGDEDGLPDLDETAEDVIEEVQEDEDEEIPDLNEVLDSDDPFEDAFLLGAEETMEDVKMGLLYHGIVNNVKNYGIFVSLNRRDDDHEVTGLAHQSKFKTIQSPRDFERWDHVVVQPVGIREGGLELALVDHKSGDEVDGKIEEALDGG